LKLGPEPDLDLGLFGSFHQLEFLQVFFEGSGSAIVSGVFQLPTTLKVLKMRAIMFRPAWVTLELEHGPYMRNYQSLISLHINEII
jgi:hypothetical protein